MNEIIQDKPEPTISFLLGSGFSIPEGIPGVNLLNKAVLGFKADKLLVNADQRAYILNEGEDRGSHSFGLEEKFVQEFIEFYNKCILKEGETFNYETFFDFYTLYKGNPENQKLIEVFVDEFNDRYCPEYMPKRNCANRIADFNRSFNQLIAAQLHFEKHSDDYSTASYPQYEEFINLLVKLLKDSSVKIHTLNHDIFFEWIGSHVHGLASHFTDGFELAGSPFYGLLFHHVNGVRKHHYVKLEHYTGNYCGKLSLFKLHGSITCKICYTRNGSQQFRIKSTYGIGDYYYEKLDENSGKPVLEGVLDIVNPDFISGTTNKLRYYSSDPFYNELLQRFKENLIKSEKVFVIGYGFQDPGINDILVEDFLSHGKKMIVIDPIKPATDLIDKYSAAYIPRSIADINSDICLMEAGLTNSARV